MNPEVKSTLEKIVRSQKENFEYDWRNTATQMPTHLKNRIADELESFGPITELLARDEVSEILINGYKDIYYEKFGIIYPYHDHFFSQQTYLSCLDRISQLCGTYLTRDKPFIESQFKNLRISIVFSELSRGQSIISIRKHRQIKWTLKNLLEKRFFDEQSFKIVTEILALKKNFLVIGSTGTGKTTFMQALLNFLPENERVILIEDTQEIDLPNKCSIALTTRQDPAGLVIDIDMAYLLNRALRLRPDRIVIGEIRGHEAKNLLLALSTGHCGCFSSLHANSAEDALLRLELLVQMGAPQWQMQTIRKLIHLSLDYIFIIKKQQNQRWLNTIYEISSLEENGFTFNSVYEKLSAL